MRKSCKPKFYIVYPTIMVDQIEWPEGCAYRCAANLASMLQDKLNCKSIGTEWKLIWNNEHRKVIMDKNDVTSNDIDDYVRADSNMLSFLSERTRTRAVKFLRLIGGVDFICVDSYRDVILQQAFFYKNKTFKLE